MTRLARAWRALEREQRHAALAAFGLFLSMFLPWYSKTNTVVVHGAVRATATSLNAFQAFSFVEAAVLLVSAAVLAMLFARAESREFRLPGGDGLIVMLAGGWSALLVFYRLLDKPSLQDNERISSTVGVEWGVFIALLLALALLYVGTRMRALQAAPPPLLRPERRHRAGTREAPGPRAGPGDAHDEPTARERARPRDSRETPLGPRTAAAREAASLAQGRPRYPPAPPGQLSFEDPPLQPER